MSHIKHPLIKTDSVEARLYQELIVTRIIEKGNSLVVAPTALGKTVVAVMLAANVLHTSQLKKKILFLAPTKPLAVQHENSFKRFLEIPHDSVVSITGTTKPEERQNIYETALVINATPQTIENDILTGKINLKNFGLVIFDEAHRATGEYAYVFINAQLQKQNPAALVLALTASPGSTEEQIQDVCRNLSIKNLEIKSEEDSDVKPYINEMEIDWVKVTLPDTFIEIKQLLEHFQHKQLVVLKGFGLAVTDNKKYYNRVRILEMQTRLRARLIAHGRSQPSLYVAASKCAALLKIAHAEELIETQGIGALKNYFEKIAEDSRKGKSKAARAILADEGIAKAIRLTNKLFEENVQHPKYEELLKILKKQFAEKPDSKAIVFNHYRDSIKEVAAFLEKEPSIHPTKFIGQATKGSERGMSQKFQQEVLEELRSGKYNVLVASSVAEEGLDIPSVDLVVFFEPVPSEIRTIQRRGRTGRFAKGKTIILMAKGTRDEAFYWAGRAKERNMKETLREMKRHETLEQQTLLPTFSEKKDEITIFCDTREQASTVTKKLFDMPSVKVIMKQLDIGDYILSNEVCVERKTIEDFVSSMIDGRLFTQLVSLRESYPKVMILLEGNLEELFTLRDIHRNSIIGALTSIALDYQVPVVNTKNPDETAEYLYVVAKREQLARDKQIGIRFGRKGLTIQEKQRFIIEGFPLIGPQLARNLLEKFGSIKAIIDASEKELQEVEGVGKKKARELQKIIRAKYAELEGTVTPDTDEELAAVSEEVVLDESGLEEEGN